MLPSDKNLRINLLQRLEATHGRCAALFPDEAQLLEKVQATLAADKWGTFLVGWARALAAYQTPISFVTGVDYQTSQFEIAGSQYPAVFVRGARYDERARLMALQKPYAPRRGWGEYDLRLEQQCLLCQNVAQTMDASIHPGRVANPLIFDLNEYVVLPNRYPARPGACLFMAKNHDLSHGRVVLPPRTATPRIIPSEIGKTRGNIPSARDLQVLFKLCDAFDFIAIRNHVLDAMSIPEHDHFHLAPIELPAFDVFRTNLLATLEDADGHASGTKFARGSPFDSVVLVDQDRSALIARALSTFERLERDHQVFTIAYYSGHILISPRRVERLAHRSITVGAAAPLHTFDAPDAEFLRLLGEYVPRRGEFGWQRYLN